MKLLDHEKYPQMYAEIENQLHKLLKCNYLKEYTVAVILPIQTECEGDMDIDEDL